MGDRSWEVQSGGRNPSREDVAILRARRRAGPMGGLDARSGEDIDRRRKMTFPDGGAGDVCIFWCAAVVLISDPKWPWRMGSAAEDCRCKTRIWRLLVGVATRLLLLFRGRIGGFPRSRVRARHLLISAARGAAFAPRATLVAFPSGRGEVRFRLGARCVGRSRVRAAEVSIYRGRGRL